MRLDELSSKFQHPASWKGQEESKQFHKNENINVGTIYYNCVSYNNAFRIVFGLSRDSSATLMFIDYNIRNFYDIRKVAVRSIAVRNLHSKNCIIDFVSDSSIHYDSELSKIWRNILQTN